MGPYFASLVGISIVSAILCAVVAVEKGRTPVWGIAGLFGSILGLIAVAGLPEKTLSRVRECVFCGELINLNSKICPYCRSELGAVQYCSVPNCWKLYLEPDEAVNVPCLEEDCEEQHVFCEVHGRERN